jgi:hypothetical protein
MWVRPAWVRRLRLGQGRALGQAGRYLGGDGLGFGAAEVADQRDHRVAGGIGLGVEARS